MRRRAGVRLRLLPSTVFVTDTIFVTDSVTVGGPSQPDFAVFTEPSTDTDMLLCSVAACRKAAVPWALDIACCGAVVDVGTATIEGHSLPSRSDSLFQSRFSLHTPMVTHLRRGCARRALPHCD